MQVPPIQSLAFLEHVAERFLLLWLGAQMIVIHFMFLKGHLDLGAYMIGILWDMILFHIIHRYLSTSPHVYHSEGGGV